MAKTYTAQEAIENAKERPELVWQDKAGDYWAYNKDSKIAQFWFGDDIFENAIFEYEPFTCYRLVPEDDDTISPAAAKKLKSILGNSGGKMAVYSVTYIHAAVDSLTRSEE